MSGDSAVESLPALAVIFIWKTLGREGKSGSLKRMNVNAIGLPGDLRRTKVPINTDDWNRASPKLF